MQERYLDSLEDAYVVALVNLVIKIKDCTNPLLVSMRPCESISMEFMGSLPRPICGHNYLFVVVNIFSNMCTPMPCKNTIKGQ
jgi:hypothetical protein